MFTREAVVLSRPPDFHGCIVSARVAGRADLQTVVTALAETMGAPEFDEEDGLARWMLADGKRVFAELTGAPDEPGIAVTIRAGRSVE